MYNKMNESNVLRLARMQAFLDGKNFLPAESKTKLCPTNNVVNTTAKSFASSEINCLPCGDVQQSSVTKTSAIKCNTASSGFCFNEHIVSEIQEQQKDDSSDCDTKTSTISSCTTQQGKNFHSSEDHLREVALQRPVISIFNGYKCPPSCSLGGSCVTSLAFVSVVEELQCFWGDTSVSLTTTQRRKKIISKLLSAYHRNKESKTYFVFSVGTSIGQDRRVCESTYLKVIGLGKTNMWRRTKSQVLKVIENGEFENFNSKGGFFIDEVLQAIRQTKAPSEQKSRHQSESCTNFIKWFGKLNGSLSPNEGEENLVVLPLETLAQFYVEYCFQCEKEGNKPACKETFRVSYLKLKKEGLFKFTRGKGTFPTCDICNNANDLLANSKSSKMSTQVRDLIMDLKVIVFISNYTSLVDN